MSLSSTSGVLRSSSNAILARCWHSGTSVVRASTISTAVYPATFAAAARPRPLKFSPQQSSFSRSSRQFSSTTAPASSASMSPNTQALIEVAKSRRTYYALGRNAPVPDSEVVSLVNEAILHVPSSFNTQSTRLVVALGADHEKVWDIAADALKGLVATGAVPQETYDTQTKPKLDSFKAAYGTVLFYEDPAHIKPLGEKFPAFASKFPEWADHSNAMHQWFIWAGLETLGFGANLQHYNPLVDPGLSKAFDVPAEWQLKAQLVFGSIESPASEKTFKPVEERVKIFGAK